MTNTASIVSELQSIRCRATTRIREQTTIELASCSAVTFTGPMPYAGSAGPMAVVRLVDMNHDGHLDAVATHEIDSGGVDVFLNDGAGGLRGAAIHVDAGRPGCTSWRTSTGIRTPT